MTLAEIIAQLVPTANKSGAGAGILDQLLEATPPPAGSSPSSIAVAPMAPRPPAMSEPSAIAGSLAALPQRDVPDRPTPGSEYTAPPTPHGTSPITTGSVAPRTAPQLGVPERSGPGIGERVGGFFAGLSGPDALAAYQQRGDKARDREQGRFAQNQTFQALIAKGVDEDTARAAVTNPDVLRAVLPNVFGGGQTDDWKEYSLAKREGFQGSFVDFKQQTKRTNQPIKVDAGTSWQLVDPMTREVVGVIPKDIAGAAEQKKLGTDTAEARVALPAAIQGGEEVISVIDRLLTSDALGRSVGPQAQYMPSVTPGATAFDAAYEQIKGRAFLQAFQSLRGGGAITEEEGKKATAAIGRLSRAQDDADFKEALSDLRELAVRGIANARAKAAGDFSGNAISRGGGAQTSPGTVRTYNPATGRLE